MAVIEPLRPFQEEDLPFFMNHPKSLILYEPRLGKTVLSCNILAKDPLTKRVLIACSKNALSVWIDHISSWFKELRPDQLIDFRLVRGKGSNAKGTREKIWSAPQKEGHITFYLTTFAAALNDYPYLQQHRLNVFDTIIGDEVHKQLKNRKTKSTVIFYEMVQLCRRFHPLSGTLVGKWGQADYWNLLHLCNPSEFRSYWSFFNTFTESVEGFHGGREVIGNRNEHAFQAILDRYGRIRKRAECAPQMPPVHRDLLWEDPTDEQRALYSELEKTQFIFRDGLLIASSTSLENAIRKRQIATCPKILSPNFGYGAAIESLVERLEEAREEGDSEGTHTVIFSAFRASLQHFAQCLREHGFNDIFQLAGGTEPEDLVRIIGSYRRTRGIMLCTTQFAQAFSLEPATVCYHIGWDYDPNNNKQAEDRLVPQQGTNPILSYYYALHETDDDIIAERMAIRQQLIHSATTDTRAFKTLSREEVEDDIPY